MYVPFIISSVYMYISNKHQKTEIRQGTTHIIFCNLMIIELAVFLLYYFSTSEIGWISGLINIVCLLICQDLLTFIFQSLICKFIPCTQIRYYREPYYLFYMSFYNFLSIMLIPLLISIWLFPVPFVYLVVLL